MKSINFSSRREAGAVHGNEETVDVGGKGERPHDSRLGA